MTAPSPPPDEATLHEAALRHLARYAATEAGLLRVLRRRILRWADMARRAGLDPVLAAAQSRAAEAAAVAAVRRLARAGVLDDAGFAAARARRLHREGRSARAIEAHLRARGIEGEVLQSTMAGRAEDELGAALAFARRRRIGPFGEPAPEDPARRKRALAALARAGFSRDIALAALGMNADDAEAEIVRLRQS